MQDISSSIDQMPPASKEGPLQKRRSEEPTTKIADFCNKICQEATYAPQRTASLFDHFVGGGKQRRRDG